jgi:hypothetical protein
MNRCSVLAWTIAVACWVDSSVGAFAQETHKWSDIDCTQSRIAATAGLKCRATQEYSGGQGVSGAGAGGTFRNWSAFGTLGGVKFYYRIAEATSLKATIQETLSLESGIKSISKDAKDFSALKNRGGVDFLTFVSAKGESCVGIRRYGPSTQTGYKWILNATRCSPKDRPASEAEIDKFISEADYRS